MKIKEFKQYVLGWFYNIPTCCIKQYVEDLRIGRLPGEFRKMTHGLDVCLCFEYVPCNVCAGRKGTELYFKKKREQIVWMVHNCPMTEMPEDLRESLKGSMNQNECMTKIDRWLSGLI